MIDDATLTEWEQNHNCGKKLNPDYAMSCRICDLLDEIRRLREEVEGQRASRDKYHQDWLYAKADLAAHRAVMRELADMLTRVAGLAAGLDDDDPWFGERRGAKAILDCVAPLLAHPLVVAARKVP